MNPITKSISHLSQLGTHGRIGLPLKAKGTKFVILFEMLNDLNL